MPANAFDDALTKLPAPANPFDDIADEIAGRRTAAVSAAVERGARENPDQQANLIRMADRLRVPLDVLKRNPDAYKGADALRQTDLDRLIQDSPRLAQHLTASPEFASVAHDDLPALGGMEQALARAENAARAAGSGLYRSATTGLFGLIQGAAERAAQAADQPTTARSLLTSAAELQGPQLFGQLAGRERSSAIAQWAVAHRQAAQTTATDIRGPQAGAGRLERGIYSGIESVGMTVPGILGSILTKDPTLALAMMGGQTTGEAYGQARDQNVDTTKAGLFATVQGLIEVGTEAAPLGWLLKDLGAGAGFVKTLAHQALSETLGEEAATAMQDLAEFLTLPENAAKSWRDYAAERPGAALDTLVATVASVGATMGIATGAQTLVTSLGQAASTSKTAKRSPEAVEHFVAQAVKDSPTKAVYAPIETWTTYWQSKGEDPARMAADLTGDPQAYQRAVDLGADLEIPLAKYAAKLAPTEHNAFFANELRLDPADMNAREAAAYAEQVQQQQEQATQGQPADTGGDTVRAELVTRLVEGGQMDRASAETVATVLGGIFPNVADRAGIDLQTLARAWLPEIRSADAAPTQEASGVRAGLALEQRPTAPGPVGPANAQGESARFVFHWDPQEQGVEPFPQYDIVGGELDGSTVSAETLKARGIPVPETPAVSTFNQIQWGAFTDETQPAEPEDQARVEAMSREELNALADKMGLWRPGAGYRAIKAAVLARFGKATPAESGDLTLFQSPPRSTELDLKVIGDLSEGRAAATESESGSGVPSGEVPSLAVMVADVRRVARVHPEIFGAVVRLVPIEMVDRLFGSEGAAEQALRDDPVFRSVAASADVDHPVAEPIDATSPVGMLLSEAARKAAEMRARATDAAGRSLEAGAAVGARQGNRLSLSQDPNASVTFIPGQAPTIKLFSSRNLSSVFHEFGHVSLEMLAAVANQIAAIDVAARTPAQQQILADVASLDAWLADEDHTGPGYSVKQHEQMARGLESYLLEGKAPSVELRSVFARVRAWMLSVYRNARALNVTLTPDVRQVFDRLLASDVAISQAQQTASVSGMFLTAEQAGMSEAEFASYRGRIEDASRKAKEELDRQLLAEVHREQTATWKAQRESIRQQVEAEVQQQPVYRVLAAMQKGTHPNGEPLIEGEPPQPLKLSKTIISNRYGPERLKALPKPYIYSRDGGLDPDSVAEMFGFSSGDALLTAVTNAQPIRSVIERETAARMFQQHGSLLLDGTLGEQAQAAVANDYREDVIRTELRALIKILSQQPRKTATAIRKGIPPATVIRQAAAEQIARTRFGDIRPQTYWAAGMKAARQATEFAARQQVAEAVDAKQKQLYNLALYREAVAQKADMERRVAAARELNSPASRARIGKAGGTFQDQIDGILDQYEFARVSQTALDRRASLRRWIAAQEGEGLPVDLPDGLVDETRRIHYRDLTVERLIGVTDGLKQIVHLARLKNKLLKSAAKRDLDETAATLGASIRDQAKTTRQPGPRDRRQSEERRRTVADFFAGHRKLASMLREMDGFEDGGPAWEAIMRPLNDAGDREAEMNAAATATFAEIIEKAYPGKEKRTLYTRLEIPAITQSLSKMERLMVALNWGNDGNRDRVRSAEGWTDQQVRAVLDTLDRRDLDFVQGVFDFFESYRPEIGAKQQRVYGIEPTWVEAAPIQAAAGEIRGGYFPLKYDDRLSASAIAKLDLEAANLAKQAAYSQATTKRGHTKDRVEHLDTPVRLDFGVLFEHVKQVIHDLSHHEALIDVGRILGHRDVQQAILETHGDLVYKQMRGAIRDIAFGDVPAVNGFERALNHVRAGATVAGLGWNLTTAFLQPLGLTNSAVRVGPKWIAKGLTRWLRSPSTMVETVEWVTEKSAFMRNRARTQQREINEIRNAVGVNTGVFSGWIDSAISTSTFNTVTRQGIADSYFWLIQQMQRVADVPTWLGQYEKSMAAGEPEDRAVALADQAVLDSQGGGQIKDLAQVQRGGPMMKLWTNFYSFFSVLHNQAVESKRRTTFSSPGSVGRLASDYLMLFIIPATLGYVVREAMRPGDDGDDEDALAWKLLMESASYISGTMLGLREISGTLQGYYGYEGPAGARAFSALSRLGKQVQQGEADAAFWRALNDMGGILFHYPSGQARRTVEGIAALSEGRTSNPGAVIAGPPPKGQ